MRKHGGSGRKANITMSAPSEPKFIRQMREQIAQDESNQREQRLLQRAANPKVAGPDDDFTVVKLNQDDLTQEEYDRMKRELETHYKLDNEMDGLKKSEKFDIDSLLQSTSRKSTTTESRNINQTSTDKAEKLKPKKKLATLTGDSSSSDED